MKTIKTLLTTCALGTALTFIACTSGESSKLSAASDTHTTQALSTAQRGTTSAHAQTKELGYKTLVRFERGMTSMDISTLSALQDKNVSLVVFYESDAIWAENFSRGEFKTTGNDILNGLMASYELMITKHIALDDYNEAIILETATGILKDAIKAATDFSMVDNVLMVELKEAPIAKNASETVSN